MKLQLPPTEVFYRRAMERSAEIRAWVAKACAPASAAELIEQSGRPNMLEGRELRLRIPSTDSTAGGAR